jgi:hypothetical protein
VEHTVDADIIPGGIFSDYELTDYMQTVTPVSVRQNWNSFSPNEHWFNFHSARRSRSWNTSLQ